MAYITPTILRLYGIIQPLARHDMITTAEPHGAEISDVVKMRIYDKIFLGTITSTTTFECVPWNKRVKR